MNNLHSIYTKLSLKELREWKAEFHLDADSMSLATRVVELGDLLGDHAISTPQAEFWRTAYNASKFALHRKAKSVRLLKPEKTVEGSIPPDCEMSLGGVPARYEIVEALQPGRRRGDECRVDRAQGPQVRPNKVLTPKELRSILASTCQIKVEKAGRYEKVTGLIVVLNVWSLREEQRQRRVWTEGTLQAAKVFDEVWILQGGASSLVWNHRRPALLWSPR